MIGKIFMGVIHSLSPHFSWGGGEPVGYGNSRARGPIGAASTSLRHSHSSMGSEPLSVTYTIGHAMLDP